MVSPNRVVAFLTPLVFAPAAGAVSAWIAQHFPGVDVKESDLQAIFIAGALIALAPAAQWLHGWQKWEARQDEQAHDVELANASAAAAAALQAGGTDRDSGAVASQDDTGLGELADMSDLDADLALLSAGGGASTGS